MSNNLTPEPEILYLVASVEPSLNSSICNSTIYNSTICSSSSQTDSNSQTDKNQTDYKNQTDKNQEKEQEQELELETNQPIYLIVVDDVPKSYVHNYERAKELSYKYVSHLFISETDRNYQSEWITDNTLVVRSYPKFSPTRYDRIDSIVQIYEVQHENTIKKFNKLTTKLDKLTTKLDKLTTKLTTKLDKLINNLDNKTD